MPSMPAGCTVPRPAAALRPGWTEIVVGLAAWLLLVFGVATLLRGTDPAIRGLSLSALSPIGEEVLFHGVVTSALLRYGAVAGVVGGAVVFALAHGINSVLITALVVGLVTGELRRRSGSIRPGVMVHIVNNSLVAIIAFVLAPQADLE